MTQEEILDGNKTIAEYMGYTYYPHNDPRLEIEGKDYKYDAGWKRSAAASNMSKNNLTANAYLCRNHNDLQYHSSWDWLMCVVDKIEKGGDALIFFEIGDEKIKIVKFVTRPWYSYGGTKTAPDTKLQATFKAVVECIKGINLFRAEKEENQKIEIKLNLNGRDIQKHIIKD